MGDIVKIVPVIMCGGSGTRLWPLSRSLAPKQLQPVTNEKSLLANTVLRLIGNENCIPPVLICGEAYGDDIEAQMASEKAPLSAVITEPKGRDTAAAAAIAAHWVKRLQNEDASEQYVVVLLPADHHISDVEGFHRSIEAAGKTAIKGYVATIGIQPTAPETGFGYIKRHADFIDGLDSYPVMDFVEKPDLETAKSYLNEGSYLWNAGMFAFSPSVFLEELQMHAPEIATASEIAFNDANISHADDKAVRVTLKSGTFLQTPALSVDYAVMEKTTKASVLPADIGWNDVGSWAAVYEIAETDTDGNAIDGEAVTIDSKNNLLKSDSKVIAAVGVNDLIIVDTPNAILVGHRDHAQSVKKVHKQLSNAEHPAAFHDGVGSSAHGKQIKDTMVSWLKDDVFPFWIENGEDKVNGGVHEAVDFTGKPFESLPKRLRVQARQTYVYAHGHLLGFDGALEAMHAPLSFMLDKGQVAPGQFAHTLTPSGDIIQGHADTYDHAFVLFSLAWAYKVTGDQKLLQVAENTMQFLLTSLRHPTIGFKESLPSGSDLRRANPHMHLLEASMTWMKLHNHPVMADLAKEIYTLFKTKFCVNGLLREYFEEDLSPLVKAPSLESFAVEPGHLYEWAYLLKLYEELTGSKTEATGIMEAFADKYGISSETGLVLNTIYPDGSMVSDPSSRLWPQTEYIRLKLSYGNEQDKKDAMVMFEKLKSNYLTFNGKTPGYWKDQLDYSGVNLTDKAPASSFYHLLGCLALII